MLLLTFIKTTSIAITLRIFLLILLSFTSYYSIAEKAKISIIIDDIGYRKTDCDVLKLPTNITLSVLPHTPYGKSLALQGFEKHHEIMLHIPMEAENGKFLGPGGLTSNMDEISIREKLNDAFTEVPFAIGINNHMGSLLTTRPQSMLWVMQFLKEKDVVFVDSITSSKSQASAIAKQLGIPALERDIFLDNKLEHKYIAKQFALLIERAKEHKMAIAIAHPHPETIHALLKLLPLLDQQSVELVPVSQLFERQQYLKETRHTE
ncbi:divergent polysaccharide deacetylase family protein [Pseudocolwellia sp. HL-MZ19]|uniref:divergent polysaccharide deacetylase family protein n=1 Tax=unclassified Pseudocolwellia TaxID=2848178 RepID=UPI003CF11220